MPAIVIKVTEKCNSDCIYCYSHDNSSLIMTMDILENSVMRINDYLACNPDEVIDLIWHGGEPLLAGADFYKAALGYFNLYCKKTSGRINHSIQTNLTLFDKSFVEIFKELGITSIGTSYDPSPGLRGACNGNNFLDYNIHFIKGLEVLHNNGFDWGLIYVVTKQSLDRPLDTFHFLTNMQVKGNLTINPVTVLSNGIPSASDVYEITPEDYLDYLGSVFREWWVNKNRYQNVQPFISLWSCLDKGERNNCMHFGICEVDPYKVIISPCGDYINVNGADALQKICGNVKDKELGVVFTELQSGFRVMKEKQYYSRECRECRFISLCGMDTLDTPDFIKKDKWCITRIGFIEKYFEPVTGINYTTGIS